MDKVKETLENNEFIKEAHHIHIWCLDEKKIFLEAHLVIEERALIQIENIKKEIRSRLKDLYSIQHTTFEFEITESCENC